MRAAQFCGAIPHSRLTTTATALRYEVYRKQIDKLQTNHRGVFVLKDYSFRWLAHLSHGDEAKQRAAAARLLRFPCGLLRGALANLGLRASVSADPAAPACSFNIRIDAKAVRS